MVRSVNRIKRSVGSRVFDVCNTIFFILLGIVTLYPFWDALVVSVSPMPVYLSTKIHLWTPEISLNAYEAIFALPTLWTSYLNSIFIVCVGTVINLILTTMTAYVLSKRDLRGTRTIMKLIVFTMMFDGGLIPNYIIIRQLNLMNTLWALIFPVAISTYNLIVLRNFFSSVPQSLEESAMIDGCTEIGVLTRIVIPTSKPAIMTIALFYAVMHWNSYFSAVLYINDKVKWPLQLFLRSMLFENDMAYQSGGENLYLMGQPAKMAAVMLAVIPIMCIYPFFQKHFAKGIMLGAVKG